MVNFQPVYPGDKLCRPTGGKSEIRPTFVKTSRSWGLQLSAGQTGFCGVGSVTSSRCSTQDKAGSTPPFPTPVGNRPYFHLFLQGAMSWERHILQFKWKTQSSIRFTPGSLISCRQLTN